ncbi:unnamed protein product [Rotaria sp. Silwood1]|nr:unnamed protein product [Rotaria sp. Silwood1]
MLNRLILLIIFSSSLWFVVNCGDEFEDYRCRCVCPSLTVLQDPTVNETNRRVYVDVVAPDNCTCERVVFRTMKVSPSFQQRFCPRCVCNYEVRNTTTMKARRAALATLLQNEQQIYEQEFHNRGKALYKDMYQIDPQCTPLDLYR